MRTHRLRSFAACLALLCAHAAAAAPSQAYGSAYLDADGIELQAGQFTWLPDAQPATGSPVTLLVSLRDQRGYLYRDGRRIAVTTLSTGLPGHDTPTGVFPIMAKEAMHHSNRYDNAPMPWMQRLTRWGHALHAGKVRNGPASHGCVRLPAEFAKQLFSMTRPGDLVVIARDDSGEAMARAGVDATLAPRFGDAGPLQQLARELRPVENMAPLLAGGAAAP